VGLCACIAILLACGGGEGASSPFPSPQTAVAGDVLAPSAPVQQPSKQPAVLATSADASQPTATELFDWAEWAYPLLFPVHSSDLVSAPYTYRYYATTGNYIGVAAGRVYVLGPVSGGALLNVGSAAQFTCDVKPQSCGTSLPGLSIQRAFQTTLLLNMPLNTPMSLEVGLHVTGDVALLLPAGTPLYVVGQDPNGVVVLKGTPRWDSVGDLEVRFDFQPQSVAGMKSGTVRLLVCVDPSCEIHLDGSPILVSYAIYPAGPPIPSRSSITASGPAGQSQTQTFTVALPANTSQWGASASPPTVTASSPFTEVSATTSADGSTGTVSLNLNEQYPGTYTGTVTVWATLTAPDGHQQQVSQEIPVSYTATGAAAPSCTFPQNVELSVSLSDLLGKLMYQIPFTCIDKTAFPAYIDEPIQYLSGPLSGVTDIFLVNWLGPYDVTFCDAYAYPRQCLPTGIYTAQRTIPMSVLNPSTNTRQTVYFNVLVTLTVTP